MSRLRLQHFIVQPILVLDDGDDELTLLNPPADPRPLTLSQLRLLLENWPAQLAALQAEYDKAQAARTESVPKPARKPPTRPK